MNRQPCVAGRFYPGDAQTLTSEIDVMLGAAPLKHDRQTLVGMVPHAGYVFSGPTCGKTLGCASLAPLVIMLGPNHTGMGAPMSLWPEGDWLFPGGSLGVDAALAARLLDAVPLFSADTAAHVSEHSLEVVLPFLHRMNPDTRIIPVAVADPDPEHLLEAGEHLGKTLADYGVPASIVVSSDMSHYVSDQAARDADALAVEAALSLDPKRLYATVRNNHISMCGVLPMTMALAAAKVLGASNAELVAYTTSAEASGDYSQVVGYAGIIVD